MLTQMTKRMESSAEVDLRFMEMAMQEAQLASEEGEIPVGAVIVAGGKVIAKAHNQTERLGDVTAHAEMIAITSAQNYFDGKVLPDCTLYVTLEPCPMCAGAIGWARLKRVVWGADDPKRGYRHYALDERGPLHPKTEIGKGVLADQCLDILQSFFRSRR